MSTPLIELKGIYKAFSGNHVLKNIDLMIKQREVLCLAGENGCGKSTIIKIISGVYPFDSGELTVNGKKYTKISPAQSIDEGVHVIYQDFSLFPNLTVAENIAFSSNVQNKRHWVSWQSNRDFARRALEKIGIDMDLNKEVSGLSVAQKQIVAISRAISQQSKIIVMDEPTTALTRKEIDRLFEIIRNLKQQGVSVIFVSHKLDEIFEVCDRIAVIRSGEKVIDEVVEKFPRDKLAYYMTGKEIEEEPFLYNKTASEPLIEVQDISLSGAFERVSFSVCPGEILAITGQLGSGRTELAAALFGIHRISSGKVLINGKETRMKNRKDALSNGIAYVPEDRLTEGLFLNRSLGDNFSSAIIDKLKNRFGIIREKVIQQLSDYWVDQLNMSKKPYTTPAGTFSGGNQQRIVVGKWLASNPKIFILNGPTVGVDVKSKSEIHDIMKDLARKGLAIIMITDDIGEVLSTSNRVIVMNGGKVKFSGQTNGLDHKDLNDKIIAQY